MMTQVLVLMVTLAAVVGCSNSYYQTLVVKSAADEHGCPSAAIDRTVSEDRMAGNFAYWMNVCGQRRLYRMDTTTGGRFVDQTQAVR